MDLYTLRVLKDIIKFSYGAIIMENESNKTIFYKKSICCF